MAVDDPCLAAAVRMQDAVVSQRAATARVRSVVATMAQRDRDTFLPPRRCVLVLHDTDVTRDALAGVIARELRVKVVECASTAHARVSLSQDRPAVIVADYHLGPETCARLLSERAPAVGAVIVTARLELGALESVARGVRAHLAATPVTEQELDDLIATVRRLLDAVAPETT